MELSRGWSLIMRNVKISADISKDAKRALDAYSVKHERSRSWLLNRMILKFCTDEVEQKEKGGMSKAPRSKPKKAAAYPSNLDEQFEILWDAKGKKGAKNGTRGAYEIFKKLAANVDDETCEIFVKTLVDDINKHSGEPGYPEMHLTSYLNQERWDR